MMSGWESVTTKSVDETREANAMLDVVIHSKTKLRSSKLIGSNCTAAMDPHNRTKGMNKVS